MGFTIFRVQRYIGERGVNQLLVLFVKPREIVRILEETVTTPFYGVIGVDKWGNIILVSDEAGCDSLYTLNPATLELSRVSTRVVLGTVKPVYKAGRLIYVVDVSGGGEQGVFYVVDLEKGLERRLVDMEPVRVVGAVDTGRYVYYAGVTVKDVALYRAFESGVEKLHVVEKGFFYVTDATERLVVGSGVLLGDPFSMEIFVYEVATGEFRVFTPKPGSVNDRPVISKGRVVFESDAFVEDRKVLVELDYETGEFKQLGFHHPDYGSFKPVEHVLFEEYEGRWLVVGKKNGRTRAYVDGREVFAPRGFIEGAVLSGGRLYASYSSLTRPSAVVEVDVETGSARTLLEAPLPGSVKEGLGDAGFAEIESFDGLRIPVFYIESRRARKPGPTVIYVHGGPWSEVADSWRPSLVAIAATGFHVVAPNFRGSTGYGESFRKLDIGDPGGGDLRDVEAATKWALETGLADRVVIMGYSYGGYMTLWAMACEPDLYECGVAGASVTDWEEMYELSDPIFRAFIEVLFAGRRELLRERSPSNRAENVSKPVCLIHPQNDSRTPLKPVLRFVSKLHEYGKRFELHVAPDMGHTINTVEDALKILLPEVLFLKKCVMEKDR